MPTSDLHQSLVRFLLDRMERELGATASLSADLGPLFGLPQPPLLANARPDAMCRCTVSTRIVLGEAKTRRDIQKPHTERQLEAYFAYLCHQRRGELWLAVPWAGIDEMYFMAVQCRRAAEAAKVPFTLLGIGPEGSTYLRTIEA